jgi:hypothetical protein
MDLYRRQQPRGGALVRALRQRPAIDRFSNWPTAAGYGRPNEKSDDIAATIPWPANGSQIPNH